jgi:hypothetical protein
VPLAISGLRSSAPSGGTTITIAAGTARDTTDAEDITIPTGSTRTVDAAVSGAGGLDTGTIAAKQAYALYIVRSSGGQVQGLLSLSYTAPTVPSGSKYRRIGSVYTSSSSKIVAFQQNGTSNDRTQDFLSDQADLVVATAPQASFTQFPTVPPSSEKRYRVRLYVEPEAGSTTTLKSGSVETAVTAPTSMPFVTPTGATMGSYKTSGGAGTSISVVGFDESV